MGRKIPARKHMGVRDPLKQQAERYKLIKDKINNPPEKKDFQKVSHSMARFIKLKDQAAEAAKNKKIENTKKIQKKRIDNEDKPENYKIRSKKQTKQPEHRNDKQFDSIQQNKNESDESYLRRVNRLTQESAKEAEFEAKYGVEVVRNKKTGEIKLKKKPKNEIDERLKQNEINKKTGNKSVKSSGIVLTSEEKREIVKELLKNKKAEKESDPDKKEFQRETIAFGEVVHAPPTLVTPRLAKKAETVPRPGRKSLLLSSMLKDTTEETNDVNKVAKGKVSKPEQHIGTLKGKRKDLSCAMRNMIEQEQSNVVEMYRQMKKSQRLENASKL